MKALITGFSGFIGSHLTDRLISDGHYVIGIDRSIKWENIPDFKNPRLKIYHENIEGSIGDLFKDVDVVFHLCALTRPQWSIENPEETMRANVQGTVKILQHCVRNKVKRIVFASTSAIYGDQKTYPSSEDATPNPMNPYAISKLIGEQLCRMYQNIYKLQFNAIRPFNAYGTRMPITGIYTSAVATYIHALKNDIPFVKFGDGEQRRDFVYIDDVIKQMMLMSTSDIYGEVFNCGYGKNYSINEMLEMVRKLMNKRIEPIKHKKQYEPNQTLSCISKAKKLLNWKPKIDLEEGLKKTIEETL